MADKSNRARREEEILKFWQDNEIFKKTLEKDSPKGEFVFYEGPPTANGRPGIHHVEARAFKDAIPRYKTMQGFHVRRKAGWDTHGLPVELEVEKQLGLKSKKEIEEYGVDKFNEKCKESVWKYVDEWQRLTDRMGYWVDLEDPYVTYHNSYIESVWNILSEVEKKKLLYKDYKVVPWCPRCGTALSSHELAQGYKDVKDLSVYVKFRINSASERFSQVLGKNPQTIQKSSVGSVYLLAWTTTPWTLPGNIALAVGDDIDYVEIKLDEDNLILAKSRLEVIDREHKVVREMKGKDLVGLEYEPLYPFTQEMYPSTPLGAGNVDAMDKAYHVYPAKFVTTQDGTGIVHTSVMYGQDDFELGNEVGLPKYHLVSDTGHFITGTGFLEGRFVKDEETDVEIIKDLAGRGLLFKKEKYEHSYPFCWRCKTPLIYYARDSWYIRMSDLRKELIKGNEKINWEPEHIKEGRFGEWLREVKDWAISRERYWGTPLPVWQNKDGSKRIVVGSVDELRRYSKSHGNKFIFMRHGESEGNRNDTVSYKKGMEDDHLTDKGKEQVLESIKELKGKKIDTIIASPFTRTRETAEIVAKELGIDEIVFDERLREFNPGDYDGKNWFDYHDAQSKLKNWYKESVSGGESYADLVKRVGEALYELEQNYQGKNILIVSHGSPIWAGFVVSGYFMPEGNSYQVPEQKSETEIFVPKFKRVQNAEIRELGFVPLPHNENFELDLHKPYIDEIVLEKDGEEYKRTPEVMDVWLDSGAMPFAQDHYPFSTKEPLYPADFISEAIDQTRGWFYTLHAISNLLGREIAYKNVICLGLLLDKEGKKMSKSVGNVVDPWEMADKYGVDSMRIWMYSVNQPGESKNFDEKNLDEINRRLFNMLDNVYSFYEMYAEDIEIDDFQLGKDANILDRWITKRSNELLSLTTSELDNYRLIAPVRAMRDFVDDLSTWYLRRSRERIKNGNKEAIKVLWFMLMRMSKILAPFAPFAAEELFQKLRGDNHAESVHLSDWPHFVELDEEDKKIISDMAETRRLTSLALEQRQKADIKVRQPLGKLKVKSSKLSSEYLELIRDELNVKEVVADESLATEVELDTTITPELELEGKMRDLVRAIQDMRKEKGLTPGEKMKYEIKPEEQELFDKFGEEIIKTTDIEV